MKKKIFIFLVILSALLAGRHLFQQGLFTMHDDLQVGRLYEMRKCMQDKQIPCRWVPDMGYGYGYPLFNFYPPLPFYIGYVFNVLGFNLIAVTKILFLIGIIGGGVFMYYLGEKIWGQLGGLVSAVFYTWAPYKAVDIYVRGALNEFWALMFFPLIIYALCQVVDQGKKYIPLLSLSYAGLLLSHNGMSMLFTPLMIIWGLGYLIIRHRGIKIYKQKIVQLLISGLWGVGLAAFFVLPAFLEKKYVHVETMLMGYFNYLAHFVSLRQMFLDRSWGYGASVWGLDDGMPFQVGIIHWLTAVPVLGWAMINFKKINKKIIYAVGFFFILFLSGVFLSHPRSTFIWKELKFLEFLQFPWRFLALATFGLSVLSGGLVKILKNKTKLVWAVLILTIALNFRYFTPDKIIKTNVEEKILSEEGWHKLQTDAIFDYLPKSADMPPAEPAPGRPQSGNIAINSHTQGTDWYQAEVEAEQEEDLIFPIFNFPNWQAWIDEQPSEITTAEELGRIKVKIPQGEHEVFLKLTDTPLRKWSNLISLLTWAGLVVVISQRKWSWLSIK